MRNPAGPSARNPAGTTSLRTFQGKLLLILERHRPLPWLLPRARELFALAAPPAWDFTVKV